jgi:hypothetical protein
MKKRIVLAGLLVFFVIVACAPYKQFAATRGFQRGSGNI